MGDEGEEEIDKVPPRYASLEPLLTRNGPFVREGFQPDPANISNLWNSKILIVGAGGLGCELLKNLALSGFKDLHVIDMDTIDVSNLNRQFLFRMRDVGKPKCQVAAEFIKRRCKGVSVEWYNQSIQDFPPDFYRQFQLVIAGLDNIEARSWLNETLVDLVRFDKDGDVDWETVIPLIDGGTEGFRGQTRLFIPRVTSCFECSLQSMAEQQSFPMCTIANVPRRPEHCIAYALKISWPLLESFESATVYKMRQLTGDETQVKPDTASVHLDKDNVEHMSWLYNRALERAQKFGIEGVTFNLTMQVVKNIIPAIASTNAIVSAACANEAFKYLSWTSKQLSNYYMYMGHDGISTEVFNYKRNPNCRVCHPPLTAKFAKTDSFAKVLEWLHQKVGNVKSIQSPTRGLVFSVLPDQRKLVDENLPKALPELFKSGQLLLVTSEQAKDGAAQKLLLTFK